MVSSGYDLIMILWGLIFVGAVALFIFEINRVFQSEERRQDALVGAKPEPRTPSQQSPTRIAM